MTFSIGVAPGIFIMLSRLILLPPTFYEKTKINKKCKIHNIYFIYNPGNNSNSYVSKNINITPNVEEKIRIK